MHFMENRGIQLRLNIIIVILHIVTLSEPLIMSVKG